MTDSSPSTSRPTPMNRYAAMAWDHWERHLPSTLATIPDPVNYFRELGSMVDSEVTAETNVRLSPVEAADPVRVAQVRREVEEELLAAYVLLPAETDTTPDPTVEAEADLVEEILIPFDSPTLARWRASPLIEPGCWEPPPPKQ